MGSTVFLCVFVVAIISAEQVRQINVLDDTRDITNGAEIWAKVGKQSIVDPDRNVKLSEPLQEMLKRDLNAAEEIFKKMYRKVKTGIMCRSMNFLMQVIKKSRYVVVTVMANREETENAAREAALQAAETAPTELTEKAAQSVRKYIKTENQGTDFGAIVATDNPDEAKELDAAIREMGLVTAEDAIKKEALEKETKIVVAKAAKEKANEVIKNTKFKQELMNKQFTRKTPEEKLEARNKFKKQVPTEQQLTEEEEENIELLLAAFNNATPKDQVDEENRIQMLERIAGRQAMKSRKLAVRDVVGLTKKNIISVIDHMKVWVKEGDKGFEFIDKLQKSVNDIGNSKVELSNLLMTEFDSALVLYYVECDHNFDINKISDDIDKETEAITNDGEERSVQTLLLEIDALNSGLKIELERIYNRTLEEKPASFFPFTLI